MRVGYYCEVCNIVLHTLAKTAAHVTDVSHISNKNDRLLKQSDKGVVVFEDILINTNSWHGLSEGSCLICEVDYTNESDHKKDVTHILKLIQSKLELSENQFVYRKIDQDSYNCLICNTIITKETKYTHCDASDHKDNYLKCQQNIKKTLNADAVNDTEKTKCDENVSDRNIVKCDNIKDTDNSKCPTETQIALINNREQELGNDTVQTPLEALSKAKAFAKEHKLKYKRNFAYCKVCDITISSSLKKMEEHVDEASHIEKAKIVEKAPKKLTKVPVELFIDKAIGMKSILFHDIVINYQYNLEILSYLLIYVNEDTVRCHVCEINILDDNVEQHFTSDGHSNKMKATNVITDFKNEFIREIRNNVFHCGYCNFVERSFDQMENHLKSENHKQKKALCSIRLESHLRYIRGDRMNEEMLMNFIRMF